MPASVPARRCSTCRDLDVSLWLARLRELGRDVNAIIELWPAPESTVEAAIAKEERWTAQSVACLRQFISE